MLRSEAPTTRVEALWDGRLYRGKLNMLDGDPGCGKTMIALDLAARVVERVACWLGIGGAVSSSLLQSPPVAPVSLIMEK